MNGALSARDMRSWQIHKYNRLKDNRNDPIVVQKQLHDALFLVFNVKFNVISVLFNGQKLEEFNVTSRTIPHEVVHNEERVLVLIKNQVNGSTENKFRVRFLSSNDCHEFCVFMSKFVTVIAYDEWTKNTQHTSTMSTTSFVSQRPNPQTQYNLPRHNSGQEFKQSLPPVSALSDRDATSVFSSQSTLPSLNVSTQTQSAATESGSPVINFNIQSLFSEEVTNRFLGTCDTLANAIFAGISTTSIPTKKKPVETQKRGRPKRSYAADIPVRETRKRYKRNT
ncbi:hypothetical protein DdX_06176 [Ditylenchus destructor]|uniref:Uncharacterized protein n=1 Tax=Ditylenchus destructor TaxID=166010 RepID=A0AAD4NBS3_9BILA|nr:hypothetical protein DdX_06176 [Ditylenchus destructor]